VSDIHEIDGDGLLRALSNGDVWLRIAGIADAALLARLMNGLLNTMVVFEHEFERRFPREHAAWLKEHDE
jgi:hypothetical protein